MTPQSEPGSRKTESSEDAAHVDTPDAGSRLRGGGVPANQLRFFQLLSLLLLVVLIAGGGYAWYRQRHLQPVTILIAGKPIVTVANYGVALSVIHQAEIGNLGAAYAGRGEPRTTQAISYQHVADTSKIDTEADAAAKLSRLLRVTVVAAVITVNGKRAVALADEATAQAALSAIQQHYVSMPPGDPIYGKPAFQERVDVKYARVPADLCKSTADQAAALMLAPPKGRDYTVQSGDTGWRIAHKFHLSLSAFLQANAGSDMNRLAPGDVVNVAPALPPLSIVVQKQATRIEPIIAGTTDGSGGERAVTDVVTYINGVRQRGSTPVGSVILKRAVPRRIIE